MAKYDVTIIGSGPGGYVCAIRCAQLGFKTAIIEKYDALGGTCLNVGCIPSKALLDSSEHYHNAHQVFKEHGINLNDLKVDMPQMIDRKRQVVKDNSDGVSFLMKKNKVDVFNGFGSFKDANTITVSPQGGGESQEISTDKVVIATGSKPMSLPFAQPDKKRIITSTEALELQEVPRNMIVIGGGYIGMELGSVYARMGTKVQVIEMAERITPLLDITMAKQLQRVLKKLDFDFHLKYKVTSVENKGDQVEIKALNKNGEEEVFSTDYALLSVGRKPYTDKLGLENVGIQPNERGQIAVDDHLHTGVANIYALGDVIDKPPMLAHKAEEEGVYVAELMAGQKPHLNYKLIPSVVYTWPEVASVGFSEEELKAEGAQYKVGKFPFQASGRARASGDTDGMVKVLADKETDELLGVHIIGPRAADMIAEAVVAMEFRASAEDIARICHSHPTYSEALKEAALDATGKRALHV